MSAFVDTSALYAMMDRDDANHAPAKAHLEALLSGDEAMLTTNYVLVEAMALIQRRLGMEALRVFSDDVLPVHEVYFLGDTAHAAALSALLTANRRDVSFVDCTSFHAMRELGIRDAFSFDAHFAEQGFRLVPSS